MMELSNRPVLSGEVQSFYLLDCLCFDRRFRFSRTAMRAFVEQPGAVIVRAEEKDRLLGFVVAHLEWDSLDGKWLYLVTLDVAPDARRRGIARQLLGALQDEARIRGAASLRLHVWTENGAARAFYAAEHFVQDSRKMDHYGPGLDALLLVRAVGLS